MKLALATTVASLLALSATGTTDLLLRTATAAPPAAVQAPLPPAKPELPPEPWDDDETGLDDPCPPALTVKEQNPSISLLDAAAEGLRSYFKLDRKAEKQWKAEDLIQRIKLSPRAARRFLKSKELVGELERDPIISEIVLFEDDFLDILKRPTALKELYPLDSGVTEGYTVEEHTLRVLELLENQAHYHLINDLDVKSADEALRLLQYTMALHDIGKGLAVRAGDKTLQERFNGPIAAYALPAFGFGKKEVRLARSLIQNDILGSMLKGTIPVKDAFEALRKEARKTGQSVPVYFELLSLYYTADAASYPYLRSVVFKDVGGKIVPKSPKWNQLIDLITESEKKPVPAPSPVNVPVTAPQTPPAAKPAAKAARNFSLLPAR